MTLKVQFLKKLIFESHFPALLDKLSILTNWTVKKPTFHFLFFYLLSNVWMWHQDITASICIPLLLLRSKGQVTKLPNGINENNINVRLEAAIKVQYILR